MLQRLKKLFGAVGDNMVFITFFLEAPKHVSGPSQFGSFPVRESFKAYLDELGITTLFYPLLLHRLKQLFGPVGDKLIFKTFLLNASKHLSGPSRFWSPPGCSACKPYLDKFGISALFYPLLLQRLKKLFGPIGY